MKKPRRQRNMDTRGPSKRRVTIASYREDRLFPRIERTVAAILERREVVTPVDVLVEMGLLAPEHLDDWRRGKVPYLERVIRCNLTKLSRILRILRKPMAGAETLPVAQDFPERDFVGVVPN